MQEDLTITIQERVNGVKLIWRCGSESGEGLGFHDNVPFTIARLKRGFIGIDFLPLIDGKTSKDSRTPGLKKV